MTILGSADLAVGAPEAVAPPPVTEAVGGRSWPARRVLAWSGPGGWKSTPPVLTPRPACPALSDSGFTTIELMVVLLVMGTLLAIAIPTVLGTTASADDRSAQSNLVTALTDAQSQFQNGGQTYFVKGVQDAPAFAGDLAGVQPSLSFRAGSAGQSTAQGSSGSLSEISVGVSADGEGLVLAAYSLPGNCFYVVTNAASLSASARTFSPYTGTAVTTSPTHAPAGPIALPATAGTTYVEVAEDTTASDCNANSPLTSGPSSTVQYSVAAFPH